MDAMNVHTLGHRVDEGPVVCTADVHRFDRQLDADGRRGFRQFPSGGRAQQAVSVVVGVPATATAQDRHAIGFQVGCQLDRIQAIVQNYRDSFAIAACEATDPLQRRDGHVVLAEQFRRLLFAEVTSLARHNLWLGSLQLDSELLLPRRTIETSTALNRQTQHPVRPPV